MGWFWADNVAPLAPTQRTAPHPLPHSGATPPPGCPMHEASTSTAPVKVSSTPAGACPYTPPDKASTDSQPPSKTLTVLQKLNPLNYMPSDLSQTREFANQSVSLPTTRDPSSIPRGDNTGTNWEYPSPQQMYNAMLRKGYTDTPAEHVESMVAVHNFLNEGAWSEIVEWERRFGAGLGRGWSACARGEDGSVHGAALGNEWKEEDRPQPTLVRFMGRPSDMTPKASLLQMLGWAWPAKYGSAPPFDRHDWFVSRCDQEGRCKEVRYVIDYYEGPDESSGEPVFFLDVRPAVDGPTHACERLLRWGGDVWWRASGGVAREQSMRR